MYNKPIGTDTIKNNGVSIQKMTIDTIALKNCNRRNLKLNLNEISTVSRSLVNLLSTRPIGVVSKNNIGALFLRKRWFRKNNLIKYLFESYLKILFNIRICKFLDDWIKPKFNKVLATRLKIASTNPSPAKTPLKKKKIY